MIMRRIMLIALLLSASSLFATEINKTTTAKVGKQPVFAYQYEDDYYILCLGSQNFTGIYDPETEEAPSIWHFKNPALTAPDEISPEKIIELPYGTPGFPFRPYINKDTMYIHIDGKIRVYDLANRAVIDSFPYGNTVYGLEKHGNTLYISTRVMPAGAWVPEDNYILLYDLESNTAIDTIPAKMNIQMLKYAADGKLYALNEGLGESDDSYITIYIQNEENSKFEESEALSAGAMGNFFAFDESGQKIYVVSNGEHKVIEYNLNNGDSFDYLLPTSGFDGPRELVLNSLTSKMRVSTYGDSFYEFEIGNPEPISSTVANGRNEGMAWSDDSQTFVLCNILNQDYSENDTITIIHPIYSSSVQSELSRIKIYPNPSSQYVNIDGLSNIYESYEIYSYDGSKIGTGNVEQFGSTLKIDFTHLNIGTGRYIVSLVNSAGKAAAFSINVVK